MITPIMFIVLFVWLLCLTIVLQNRESESSPHHFLLEDFAKKDDVAFLKRKLNALCEFLRLDNYSDFPYSGNSKFFFYDNPDNVLNELEKKVVERTGYVGADLTRLLDHLGLKVVVTDGRQIVKKK